MSANRTVSTWRAVGGRLIATDRRLLFQPNRFDAALGGAIWSVPLGKRRTFKPFSGGLRTRLRIATRDGGEHLFMVDRPGDAIAKLERLTR